MCVAAQLEIILTAYGIYENETGDTSPWEFLPPRSYKKLGAQENATGTAAPPAPELPEAPPVGLVPPVI